MIRSVVQRTEPKGAEDSAIVTRSGITLLLQTVKSPRGAEAADARCMRAPDGSDGTTSVKKSTHVHKNNKEKRHRITSVAASLCPLKPQLCSQAQ